MVIWDMNSAIQASIQGDFFFLEELNVLISVTVFLACKGCWLPQFVKSNTIIILIFRSFTMQTNLRNWWRKRRVSKTGWTIMSWNILETNQNGLWWRYGCVMLCLQWILFLVQCCFSVGVLTLYCIFNFWIGRLVSLASLVTRWMQLILRHLKSRDCQKK